MSVAETAFPGVWPVSAVVASALLSTPVLRDAINVLGVREAGTASILKMFADGFRVSEKAGYVGRKEATSHSTTTGSVRELFGQSLHDTATYITVCRHLCFVKDVFVLCPGDTSGYRNCLM